MVDCSGSNGSSSYEIRNKTRDVGITKKEEKTNNKNVEKLQRDFQQVERKGGVGRKRLSCCYKRASPQGGMWTEGRRWRGGTGGWAVRMPCQRRGRSQTLALQHLHALWRCKQL